MAFLEVDDVVAEDAQDLLDCITNEGDLYARLCGMASNGAMPEQWVQLAHGYARDLKRERRYEGASNARTILAFAVALEDYYRDHLNETQRRA